MITISIDEIQRGLPGSLKRVSAGETVLKMQGDTPVAELKPVTPIAQQQRPFGLCAGEFTVPDDFDEPLPDIDASRRSVVDILAEAPGHLAFQTAEEVDAYLQEERYGWER